jgi:hypothetical protein
VGYQSGGLVGGAAASASLTTGSIRLENGGIADEIYEKIKSAISSSEVKVDPEARVKVDVTGVSVPVNVENTKIEVDASGAANVLSDTIKAALASATVKVDTVAGGAVGADQIDSLATTIDNVQNKVFVVKGDLDDLETKLIDLENNSITIDNVRSQVDYIVKQALVNVEAAVQDNRQDVNLLASTIRRIEIKQEAQLNDVTRIANQARDLNGRSIL